MTNYIDKHLFSLPIVEAKTINQNVNSCQKIKRNYLQTFRNISKMIRLTYCTQIPR